MAGARVLNGPGRSLASRLTVSAIARRGARTPILALMLGLTAVLCACMPDAPRLSTPTDYASLLRRYDSNLKDAQQELLKSPDRVGTREALAQAWMQRALLSGDFRDYAAADRALASAFAIADQLHAPLMSRVQLNLLLHRLPQAQIDLLQLDQQYILRGNPMLISNKAELAFQQGRYAAALDGFHLSLHNQESVITLVRLAIWYARTSQYSEAAALLDRATDENHADTPYLAAWLQLQQGLLLLDRGRWEQADEQFLQSEQRLPGWWLPRSRHAEILAFEGKRDQAQALYEALLRETGHAEFMDAIARLRREGTEPASAKQWTVRAAAAHQERMKLLPEADYGAALEHELWFGRPDRALELAQRNATLRPNGEARGLLAMAMYKAGRTAEAQREIQAVLATEWNTAETHAIAAQIAAALGQREEADKQHAIAIDLNPRAFRMYPLPQPAQPEALP